MSNQLPRSVKFPNIFQKESTFRNNIFYVLLIFVAVPLCSVAQVERTLTVGSVSRQMIVYTPPGIGTDRPLVISMHGLNQTMTDQKNQTQFMSVARANNFVLVFPNAINKSWQLWGNQDIDFILAIIGDMYKKYGIDRNRVYLSGFSMGGMMTYYAATRIADKIAAFAPVSGFLMDGPNTNSSRPVPIIHVHGADDTFVPHNRVQECMDAWIKRNGCPATAKVTSPYPANKPSSKSIKYYWGPGKEGVELVFISVAGVGHWYSEDPNGVFTSQEIWNFCSRYSLKNGVPEYVYASVLNSNPKQIKLELSCAINDSVNFRGFTVKINNQAAVISNVALADSNKLVINLQDSVVKSDAILLSYNNGNVLSKLNKKLVNFTDKLVDNLLSGASPRITEVTTNITGDALKIKFNKKMLRPAGNGGFVLSATYNGTQDIAVQECSVSPTDSLTLIVALGQKVYRDYKLLLSYSGSNVASADSGLLNPVSDMAVSNVANGLPVQVQSGTMAADGLTLGLKFSKPMLLTSSQVSSLAVAKNSKIMSAAKSFSVQDNEILLTLPEAIHFGDSIAISYSPGTITGADHGALDAFSGLIVKNEVNAPVWIKTPGKVEAENFTFKSGMQTENCGDTGGGLNLGYIGNGDWLEYSIENTSSSTGFQISFRVAALSTGGVIDYYIDGVNAGKLNVPATGDWQVYKSVLKDIAIAPGKHYLKIVATVSGFNINYFEITDKQTGINTITKPEITIYPNPISNEMIISSGGFPHNKIEIFNLSGNRLSEWATAGEPVLTVPVGLSDGIYLVKIGNEKQFQIKKIVIANE